MIAEYDLTLDTEMDAARNQIRADGCDVLEPGTDGYARAIHIWNGAVKRAPALVARCLTAADVQSCLMAARDHRVLISVRGGGQDWVGRCLQDGGLVLDLSGMRQVSVNPDAREATIAGGASAADVSTALGASPLVAVTGNAGAVSMAGLLTGGGYGPLMTRFGLACDSLLRAEVVLADGRVVQASAAKNADLLWALRGGGGNFGVVTSMDVRLHEPAVLLSGTVLYPWKDVRAVFRGYAELMSSAPDELFLAVAMSAAPDGSPVVVLAPTWTGDAEEGQQLIARLQSFGTPIMTKFGPTTFGERICSPSCSDERWAGWLNIADEALRERVATLC